MARCALVVLVLALAACGDRERGEPAIAPPARVARDPASPADAGTPPQIITAPHSTTISVVAVAERADAALTADENGELRFWPALDGVREPVVIRGRAPMDLALAREDGGHVAALRDAAGGIELLHIAESGAVRRRQVVPGEPAFEELAAGTTALLARRSDHTIARLDAETKATLAPQLGEQVLAIAARRTTAIAGIGDRERPSEILQIREIQLAGELAWGRQYELPVPLAAPIALSPSGKRIAGLNARTGAGVVLELVPTPRVIGSDVITGTEPNDDVLGFLDEDRVVFRGGIVVRIPAATPKHADPWDGTHSRVRARIGRHGVVADGAVVSGQGTNLVIANGERAQFLGYRDLGVGVLRVTGDQITLALPNRVLWLDAKLERVRALDVLNDSASGLAVDATHVLKATYSYLEDDRSNLDVSLVGDKEVPLGSWSQGSTVAYDPRTQVFAVTGYTPTVARNRLDLAAATSTPLRALKTRADSVIELLDPTLADGAVAVTYASDDAGALYIETFIEEGTSTRPLAAASRVKVRDVVFPAGVDQTGTMYTVATAPDTAPRLIYGHKNGKQVKRLMVDGSVTGAAVDHAGTLLAAYSNVSVILHAMDGTERWRVPVWSANMARFTADGETLLVNTQGGLVALDTQTGQRRATGCGWGFGLSTEEPPLTVFFAPVVCAEAM